MALFLTMMVKRCCKKDEGGKARLMLDHQRYWYHSTKTFSMSPEGNVGTENQFPVDHRARHCSE